MTTTRVLIVDDDPMVRAGLRLLLRGSEVEVVGEHDDGQGAAELAARLHADVVLMDIRMPRKDGITATREVVRAVPDAKVVVLTTFDADELVVDVIRAGAAGFLLKDSAPERIGSAVKAVSAGEPVMSPRILAQLMEHTAREGSSVDDARRRLSHLTPREHEVAEALADGLTNVEIAQQMDLALPTVKSHVSSILSKLGADNRVQAALVVHDVRSR